MLSKRFICKICLGFLIGWLGFLLLIAILDLTRLADYDLNLLSWWVKRGVRLPPPAKTKLSCSHSFAWKSWWEMLNVVSAQWWFHSSPLRWLCCFVNWWCVRWETLSNRFCVFCGKLIRWLFLSVQRMLYMNKLSAFQNVLKTLSFLLSLNWRNNKTKI